MCGGHGTYRILGNLIDDTLYERSRDVDRGEYGRDSRAEVEQDVKLMYARGEIDSGTYHRLIDMAQSGHLNWEDLRQIGKTSQVAIIQERRAPRKRDPDMVNGLNQLYSRRKQLENAHQDTEEVLASLEKEADRLAEQAKTAETEAKKAIDNEEVARAYLDTRQKALDRAASVQERIDGLRQNLRRIENLEADLSTREAELKALESGEQLAELEASIRQELLSDE